MARRLQHWTPNVNSPNYGTTYPYVAHPNNLKDYFQTATNMTNSLSMNAGNEKIQGYFSYTNTQSRGIVPGTALIVITSTLELPATFQRN